MSKRDVRSQVLLADLSLNKTSDNWTSAHAPVYELFVLKFCFFHIVCLFSVLHCTVDSDSSEEEDVVILTPEKSSGFQNRYDVSFFKVINSAFQGE